MQVERQERLERCVERANPRDDPPRPPAADGDREPRTGSARTRRRERRRRTPGNAPAARARPPSRAEALLQLVQQPALAGAGSPTTATTASERQLAARATLRLQRRQLGLTADVGRQSRSARRFQPRRNPGLAEHAERRHRSDLRIEHDRRARRRVHVRPDETLRLRAHPDVAGVGQGRQVARPAPRRADDVVAARPLVQTPGDDTARRADPTARAARRPADSRPLERPTRACRSSAARTARRSSSSCAVGTPKSDTISSPIAWLTSPPYSRTTSTAMSRTPRDRALRLASA